MMFKVPFAAQRNTQTAPECALRLRPQARSRLADIERIELRSHELAIPNTSMQGPFLNFAARDHCVKYIVALALIDGRIRTESYTDAYHAGHAEIDRLRARIAAIEYTAGRN